MSEHNIAESSTVQSAVEEMVCAKEQKMVCDEHLVCMIPSATGSIRGQWGVNSTKGFMKEAGEFLWVFIHILY
jgi:hypothetical protein